MNIFYAKYIEINCKHALEQAEIQTKYTRNIDRHGVKINKQRRGAGFSIATSIIACSASRCFAFGVEVFTH